MCFSFCKYEKEKLTLLSQNLVQQTEQKRYFLLKDVNAKRHFHLQNFPPLTTVSLKKAILTHFLTFSEVKKHFSETRKGVIGKKLLGSNTPYMSYHMKFSFYLHQAYGY